MEEAGKVVFTGSRSFLVKIALLLLAVATLVFVSSFTDVQACARRQPCDLSSLLAFVAGFAMLYGAAHFAVVSRRGPPRLELSPEQIVFTRNGKLYAVPWGDVVAIRRTAKVVNFDCCIGSRITSFAVSPGFLKYPSGCADALQDHIARFFIPTAAPAGQPLPPNTLSRHLLNAFLIFLLEYGILFGGSLLVLLLTVALKAATGAVPKGVFNLFNLICLISAMQIGMALKKTRCWQPGVPALIIGSLCYLFFCLLGLSALVSRGIELMVPVLLVLSVPTGLFLGFRQGGKLLGTASS